MKIGARIIKTGITLILAIYITKFLNMEPVIYAAIAATLAIQPSIYRSWQYGIEQVQSNIVGATIAMLFSVYIGTSPIFIAMSIMLVIGINLQLRFERSIALSIVTVLSIMEGGGQETNFFMFALDRFLLIFIGIISALLVNSLIFPPKYDQKLTDSLKTMEENIASILRIILDRQKNEQLIRSLLNKLDKDLSSLWNLYHFEEETASYFKRKRSFSSMRKLVIFKVMLQTSQKGITTLRRVEKYQNTLQNLPINISEMLHTQLLDIANYQDKIYSKFEGKIHSTSRHSQNESLFKSYWNIYEEVSKLNLDAQTTLDVISVLSVAREYNKQLDHLDQLVNSYHTHHHASKK